MKTYTSTAFRQNSYRLINQVASSDTPIRITSRSKHHVNNNDTYLVNVKILQEAKKYREIKTMQKGLDKVAKHSKPMTEKEFKNAIGL